jgi:hypothetical protein
LSVTDLDRAIRQRVEDFVQEMTELVRQAALESVSAALGTPGPGASQRARGAAKRPAASFVAKSGGKRTAKELEQQGNALVSMIRQTPGIRADQLAKAMGVMTRDLALPIKKLLADKVISKKGQKRATAYFAARSK